jgi:uncharacterized protein YbaR (Trm112 family)
VRCPACRRPLAPLYVRGGKTVIEPTPHIHVYSAVLVCPVDRHEVNFLSTDRVTEVK